MPFTFKRLAIPDVVLITPQVFPDNRGHFMELYVHDDFAQFGIDRDFARDARSLSKKGVVRGLHYQLNPYAQAKTMQIASGKMFVIAVDIRRGSPHFGKWVGETLSQENRNILWIPEGFAAGAMSLEDDSVMNYKIAGKYSTEHARGIRWNDPDIGIEWPLKIDPIISERDANYPLLKDAEINFEYK